MRISNFAKGRLVAGFFRICLGIVISLTLAMGGTALNTQPVQAIGITATPSATITIPECLPFTIQFAATGTSCTPPPNPFFWTWGPVPSWITLDSNSGLLTGCPPPGSNSGSPYSFVVGVSEFSFPPLCGPFITSTAVTITVTANTPPCVTAINPTFYPVAWENIPFSMTLSATGGVGPLSWSAVGLPAGLSVTDATNGIISGTPGPGTCGIYTVTATVTDNGTCPSCCPAISRPFTLIVDCYANYVVVIVTTSYDFNVQIGPGLTSGQTKVLIDGSQQAALAGGGSQTFTSQGQNNLVSVDQIVVGSDPKTRFTVKGPNEIMVSETNTTAYFDYAQEVLIETGSDPSGIAQPPGTGFYAVGGYFSTTAPSPIDSSNQKGEKFLFREWSLPDGSTNPNRNPVFTVNKSGSVIAKYNTYYQLNIVSDYPSVSESSWELKDSTATYNLALHDVPIPNFWGVIGGVMRPLNASGTHLMTSPDTVKVLWNYDYTIPIILISLIVLLIVGLVVFLVLRSKRAVKASVPAKTAMQTEPLATATETKTAPVVAATVEKKSLTETESTEKPNFCPKCGAPVEKDAEFCKKCGTKLT
ncbi:MAG: putative Ig domain-containing protein [Dehalococcoidia bacterium]